MILFCSHQNPQTQVIQLPQVSQQVVSPIQTTVMQQLQQQHNQLQTQSQSQQQPTTQVYQQVINASGQVESIPVSCLMSSLRFFQRSQYLYSILTSIEK